MTLALALGIVLLGLVMVTSASVSIASQDTGQPFYYLERQLLLTLIGAACAALMFSIPTALLERAGVALLALAIGLLAVVLIPGLGHAVNGSRRWLHLAGVNFQVSELSRVLVLGTSPATPCATRRSCASPSPDSASPWDCCAV